MAEVNFLWGNHSNLPVDGVTDDAKIGTFYVAKKADQPYALYLMGTDKQLHDISKPLWKTFGDPMPEPDPDIPDVPVEPTIVSFSIDGETFDIESNTTWEQAISTHTELATLVELAASLNTTQNFVVLKSNKNPVILGDTCVRPNNIISAEDYESTAAYRYTVILPDNITKINGYRPSSDSTWVDIPGLAVNANNDITYDGMPLIDASSNAIKKTTSMATHDVYQTLQVKMRAIDGEIYSELYVVPLIETWQNVKQRYSDLVAFGNYNSTNVYYKTLQEHFIILNATPNSPVKDILKHTSGVPNYFDVDYITISGTYSCNVDPEYTYKLYPFDDEITFKHRDEIFNRMYADEIDNDIWSVYIDSTGGETREIARTTEWRNSFESAIIEFIAPAGETSQKISFMLKEWIDGSFTVYEEPSAPDIPTIQFTIDGNTYEANEGWTWGQLVANNESVKALCYTSANHNYIGMKGTQTDFVAFNGVLVKDTTSVMAGRNYSSVTQAVLIDSTYYPVERSGWVWGNFVDAHNKVFEMYIDAMQGADKKKFLVRKKTEMKLILTNPTAGADPIYNPVKTSEEVSYYSGEGNDQSLEYFTGTSHIRITDAENISKNYIIYSSDWNWTDLADYYGFTVSEENGAIMRGDGACIVAKQGWAQVYYSDDADIDTSIEYTDTGYNKNIEIYEGGAQWVGSIPVLESYTIRDVFSNSEHYLNTSVYQIHIDGKTCDLIYYDHENMDTYTYHFIGEIDAKVSSVTTDEFRFGPFPS